MKRMTILMLLAAVCLAVGGCEADEPKETQYRGGYRDREDYKQKDSAGYHAPRRMY